MEERPCIGLMLEAGADWDTCHGITALMLTCEHGCVETARLLLEVGAKQDLRAKNGLTPLHLGMEGLT